jgi:predicted esterase
MTKLLYLHGYNSGIDNTLGSKDAVAEMNLADEMAAFNAPFPMDGGGFKWFSMPQEGASADDTMRELGQSAAYIADKVQGMEIDVLFGASQGGFMALYLTLNGVIRPRRTIAAVPFYIPQLITENMNKQTPILWMAAGMDDMIPMDVGGAWRDLQNAGANLEYKIDVGSGHMAATWTPAFRNAIIEWNRQK